MKQSLLLSLLLAPSAAAFTTTPKQHRATTRLFSSSSTRKKDFLQSYFASPSDCDNVNTPPSLSETLASMEALANGSDIRGVFVNHKRVGSFAAVSTAIRQSGTTAAALTPFAAHCLGHGFGQMLQERYGGRSDVTVCIGNDPREHGPRLADAFSRGCSSVGITVKYTGVATTPSVMDFCRSGLCDAGVVLTASHLPQDRNGMKFFDSKQGGWSKQDVQELLCRAKDHAHEWSTMGILPPTSGTGGVYCSEWVDYMPIYAQHLSDAICQQVGSSSASMPLEGLKIVLNSGNGAGGFFYKVLEDLGADVSDSMNIRPNSDFPHGVPNPESAQMVQDTMDTCQRVQADLGILLDTDADRSGFIAPSNINTGDYEAVHKNRLIALLGVLFAESSPGCTVVTDSCTSEGLQVFLEENLGLHHERYVKGYANVIRKAKELTESGDCVAEMAIETSGHCAMKENDYLDDGTYTAVKVISLLAKISKQGQNLLDLIGDLQEMEEVIELRMTAPDMPTMLNVFDECESAVQEYCKQQDWTVDTDNLEGIRVRTGGEGFFMVRKSLHDPVMIVQVEGDSADQVRSEVVAPLLKLFEQHAGGLLDMTSMQEY